VGRAIQGGIPQKYMIALGFSIFFGYSLWAYSIITPTTAEGNFFWVLMFRGVGLGLLFVPTTTLALSSLKGKEIGQGAAFTGMVRQLGGSFGIALISTYISRRTVQHRADIMSHVSAYDPLVQERLNGMQSNFLAHGSPIDRAPLEATKLMDVLVTKQAALLTYMDVFLWIGIFFLLCIPFVLILKPAKGKVDPSQAAH
jgi:MFS transporter, DHA2 family, multidrug resistance protein